MTALESKALGIALEKLCLTDLSSSHWDIAAWKRYEQSLSALITKLSKERDELRKQLHQIEQ